MTISCKKITILTDGSRGDIQPIIALAIALKERGHIVRLLTSVGHQAFVEEYGITFVNVVNMDMDEFTRTNPHIRAAMASGDITQFLKAMSVRDDKDQAKDCMNRTLKELETHRPDFCIVSSIFFFAEFYVSLVLKIPTLRMHLSVHYGYNKDYAQLGLPTLPFGAHYFILKLIHRNIVEKFKSFDEGLLELGHTPLRTVISKNEILALFHQRMMGIYPQKQVICQSPMFGKIVFPNSGENNIFTGPCIIESNKQLNNPFFGGEHTKDALDKFIRKDPKRRPIYIGWGSMAPSNSPHELTKYAVQTLQICGERGILFAGNADMSLKALQQKDDKSQHNSSDLESLIAYAQQNILFIEKAPHEAIFPLMKCTVHHGGAGTTQAALRAGVPTIITPVFLDQFDNSYVVEQLGVGHGFSQQLQKISPALLSKTIQRVAHDEAIKIKCKEVASAIRKENGQVRACEVIEEIIEEGNFGREAMISNMNLTEMYYSKW
eukprot:CAMPEP_0184856362 /NCGR_PEP_ID=MMETSP0580-20130426/1544_1 /TAXON_ID=1118495 /ORGANISM="Dactyliosolen fragilissimus" /LENGTH=491 /DNA_ID=CAMNT_0027351353 /DNA_START=8 /DNA_END=1480 /DNA_ORIENTATION=-